MVAGLRTSSSRRDNVGGLTRAPAAPDTESCVPELRDGPRQVKEPCIRRQAATARRGSGDRSLQRDGCRVGGVARDGRRSGRRRVRTTARQAREDAGTASLRYAQAAASMSNAPARAASRASSAQGNAVPRRHRSLARRLVMTRRHASLTPWRAVDDRCSESRISGAALGAVRALFAVILFRE